MQTGFITAKSFTLLYDLELEVNTRLLESAKQFVGNNFLKFMASPRRNVLCASLVCDTVDHLSFHKTFHTTCTATLFFFYDLWIIQILHHYAPKYSQLLETLVAQFH